MITKDRKPLFENHNAGLIKLGISDVDTKSRKVALVGHTYNFLYHGYEALQAGAASRSIAEHGPASSAIAKIKFAWNHDLSLMPPGKLTLIDERDMTIEGVPVKVIYAEADLSKNDQGRNLLESYLDGNIDNHSIGFRYLNYEFLSKGHGNSEDGKKFNSFKENLVNPDALADDMDMACLVSEIELKDISAVNYGAVEWSPYLGTKSITAESLILKIDKKIMKLEKTIRSGKQTDECMEAFAIQVLQLREFMQQLFGDVTLKDLLLNNVNKNVDNKLNEKDADSNKESNIASDFSFKL